MIGKQSCQVSLGCWDRRGSQVVKTEKAQRSTKRTGRRGRTRKPSAKELTRSPIAQAVDEYIAGVLSGKIVAGELTRLAVQRHVQDLKDGHARGLYFDQAKAERAIEFFGYLKHSKGEWAGQFVKLEPWQLFIKWVVFGWMRKDGSRRFRNVYLEVARKNGKSTDAAGTGLYLAFADDEPGAEVYSTATKKDQAIIVHSEATRMVRANQEFQRLGVEIYKNNICRPDRAQKYEPLGADEDTMDGYNVHGAIVDELHAHKTRGAYDLMDTGTSARRQPILWAITTAGTDQTEASVCWEQHVYTEQILRGIVQDDSHFGMIFCLDKGDDWTEEKNWCLAGATEVYVKIPRGITVCSIQSLCEDYDITTASVWDGRTWVKVLGWSKAHDHDNSAIEFELSSGEKISCTGHHEWPTSRGKIAADRLCVGDSIDTTVLGACETTPSLIPPSVGWLVGLYLAEGSRSGSTIQFSGHATENLDRAERLSAIAEEYGGTCHAHAYGNKGTVNIECNVIAALLDMYIGGKIARDKYIRPAVWRQSNDFLLQLASGYLDGDGHYEAKNDRWRIGFTRNYRLAKSLRTLAARLGAQLTLRPRFVKNQTGRSHAIHRGDWRWRRTTHWENGHAGRIVAIRKSPSRSFFHIGVDNADGLFALASGVLTHNSKANPNLGVSKKLDYMREQAIKAKALPSKQNTFKRLDLNEWTQQATRWIDMGLWDANAGPVIDEAALIGRPCYGGIDLSSVSDITAWMLVFPDPVIIDRLTVLVRLWCPEARLQKVEVEDVGESKSRRRNLYAEQYQAWEREGYIMATPGNAIDYEQIEVQIAEDAKTFNIQEVAIDRLFQGYQMAMRLQEHHGLTVAACGMGYMSMAGPCAEFERRLLEKKIHHGGHPVLRWMANNVAVREDPAGNKKPDKSTSQGKIDGIVALLLGLDRVMRQQQTASVYESRGILTLGGGNGETARTEERRDL